MKLGPRVPMGTPKWMVSLKMYFQNRWIGGHTISQNSYVRYTIDSILSQISTYLYKPMYRKKYAKYKVHICIYIHIYTHGYRCLHLYVLLFTPAGVNWPSMAGGESRAWRTWSEKPAEAGSLRNAVGGEARLSFPRAAPPRVPWGKCLQAYVKTR